MKIGERGQVTIPKDIREKYGLLPRTEVDFVPQETGILIQMTEQILTLSPYEADNYFCRHQCAARCLFT